MYKTRIAFVKHEHAISSYLDAAIPMAVGMLLTHNKEGLIYSLSPQLIKMAYRITANFIAPKPYKIYNQDIKLPTGKYIPFQKFLNVLHGCMAGDGDSSLYDISNFCSQRSDSKSGELISIYELSIVVKYFGGAVHAIFRRENNRHPNFDSMELYGDKKFIDEYIEKAMQIANTDGKTTVYFIKERMSYKPARSITMKVQPRFDEFIMGSTRFEKIKGICDAFVRNEKRVKLLGLPHKTGFLFYGPPGTGKTMTAFAIARYMGKDVLFIDCTHDLESLGAERFDDRVVIVDDVDMIFGKREDDSGLTGKEKVAHKSDMKVMMNKLDSIYESDGSVVIFTTNYADRIDEALIREGRLDHHIEFGEMSHGDIVRLVENVYEEKVPVDVQFPNMTISKLINTYILPNIDDFEGFVKTVIEEKKVEEKKE